MAIFKNILRKVSFWKRSDDQLQLNDEQRITRTLREYEFYVFQIQNIIVWENPSRSCLWLGIVNFLFWLLVNLEIKLFGIISTTLLVITLHEMWFQKIWPEIRVKKRGGGGKDEKEEEEGERGRRSSNDSVEANVHPSILRLSEMIQTTRKAAVKFIAWLKTLREQNKVKFISVMAGILFPLIVIGRMMSGMLLSYLLVMTIMIFPGLWIHVIKEDTKRSIRSKFDTILSAVYPTGDTSNNDEEDEYMLEESGENLAVLSQIVDPEDTNDSFYSRGTATPISFVTGVATMPSHDDISLDSLASFSELDLALGNSSQRTVILKDIEDYSDDSSSNDPAIMDFQSGHFNGNESSGDEEENMYAKDLTFTETDCTHESSSNTQAPAGFTFSSVLSATTSNLGNLGSVVGQTLLTNVVNRAMGYSGDNQPKSGSEDQKKSTKMAKNDSSNSLSSSEDFELISHDEVS